MTPRMGYYIPPTVEKTCSNVIIWTVHLYHLCQVKPVYHDKKHKSTKCVISQLISLPEGVISNPVA